MSLQNKLIGNRRHPDLFLDPGLDRGLISYDDFHLRKGESFSLSVHLYFLE